MVSEFSWTRLDRTDSAFGRQKFASGRPALATGPWVMGGGLEWEGVWHRLGLHTLLGTLIEPGKAEVPWQEVAAVLWLERFCVQRSELGMAEHWYELMAQQRFQPSHRAISDTCTLGQHRASMGTFERGSFVLVVRANAPVRSRIRALADYGQMSGTLGK